MMGICKAFDLFSIFFDAEREHILFIAIEVRQIKLSCCPKNVLQLGSCQCQMCVYINVNEMVG
jgi:hypothetical protein